MKPFSNQFVGVALALGSVAGSSATQSLPGNQPVSITRQAHRLSIDGGVVVGGGADYRAVFSERGIEFVPALGRKAYQTHPFRLRLASIARGGAVLGVPGRAASPRVDGARVGYERAPHISERYDVRADGVALSLWFGQPLPGRGDLVVRMAIDTDLVVNGRDQDGLRFSAEGIGGVRVGGVTGIDANGRTAAGAIRVDGAQLELSLPAAFVDSAAYPLVLDPLIGTDFLVEASGYDDMNSDVAYDASNNVYLVCWQREFSLTNVEIRAQRVDASGIPLGGFITVTGAGTPVAINPTVANVNQTNRFLVAWQQGSSLFGPWDIRAACVEAAGGAVSAETLIAGGVAPEIEPDAGSDGTGSDDEAVVVWTEVGAGIRGMQVTCAAGLGAPVANAIVPVADGAYDQPAIAKNGGATANYVVVWRHAGFGIHALGVSRNMALLTPLHTVVVNASASEPDVDGEGVNSMVVWQQDEAAGADHDVRCQMVRYGAGVLANNGAAATVSTGVPVDDKQPAVGYAGDKYAVAWAEEQVGSGTPFGYDIKVRELNVANCTSCGPISCVGCAGLGYDFDPAIGTMIAGGAGSDRALITFGSASGSPPFTGEVRGQLWEAIGAGGAIVSLGGGCGAGGVANVGGPLAIGNKSFSFTLAGADPAAVVAVFVLNNVVAPLPCGPCQILPPLVSVNRPIAAGNAVLPVQVPCDSSMVGGTIQFQWWVAVTAASPCALLKNASFSNRVNATVGL